MCNSDDLAVIRARPADGATAASRGARVVLIDRYGDLGGAGANTGTVPGKTARLILSPMVIKVSESSDAAGAGPLLAIQRPGIELITTVVEWEPELSPTP